MNERVDKGNERAVRGNDHEDPTPRQPNLAVTPTVTEVGMSRKERAVSGAVDGSTNARRLLSVRDAAVYLGISQWTMRGLGWNGEIPQIKIGRRVLYDLADLDRFVELSKGK